MAVLSQLSIPVQPIPISLATLGVMLIGGLLGCRRGTTALFIYVLMGVCGLPVFARFNSGIHAITGPTGGFLIGYVIAAAVIGFISERASKISVFMLGFAAGAFVYFTAGAIGYGIYMPASAAEIIEKVVVPFLPGDAIKIIIAALITRRLRYHLLTCI